MFVGKECGDAAGLWISPSDQVSRLTSQWSTHPAGDWEFRPVVGKNESIVRDVGLAESMITERFLAQYLSSQHHRTTASVHVMVDRIKSVQVEG
ncbi:MAG: hypothetical protein R3C01_15965 [Planctomycetaceae bacterium]